MELLKSKWVTFRATWQHRFGGRVLPDRSTFTYQELHLPASFKAIDACLKSAVSIAKIRDETNFVDVAELTRIANVAVGIFREASALVEQSSGTVPNMLIFRSPENTTQGAVVMVTASTTDHLPQYSIYTGTSDPRNANRLNLVRFSMTNDILTGASLCVALFDRLLSGDIEIVGERAFAIPE